jgi:hypothetical protein
MGFCIQMTIGSFWKKLYHRLTIQLGPLSLESAFTLFNIPSFNTAGHFCVGSSKQAHHIHMMAMIMIVVIVELPLGVCD